MFKKAIFIFSILVLCCSVNEVYQHKTLKKVKEDNQNLLNEISYRGEKWHTIFQSIADESYIRMEDNSFLYAAEVNNVLRALKTKKRIRYWDKEYYPEDKEEWKKFIVEELMQRDGKN